MAKGRKYKNAKLPETLLEDVDQLDITKGLNGGRNKALHFLILLIEKSSRKAGLQHAYVPMPVKYIEKIFGTRYLADFLQALLDGQVIQCDGIFSNRPDFKKPFYYRVNPRYYEGVVELRKVKITNRQTTEKDLEEEEREYLRELRRFYETLTINEDRLFEVMYKKLDSVDGEIYKYNANVDADYGDSITVNDGAETFYTQLYKLLDRSHGENKTVIQDGGNYYYMTEDEYKQRKKTYLECYFSHAIMDLVDGNLRAERDQKGERLHTNMTNLATELREVLLEDSGMTNLDLSNSQFAIYSMLAKKEGLNTLDALRFFKAAGEGKLYEVVRDELGLSKGKKGIKEAKQAMFLINFSNKDYKSKLKTKFAEVFPSIAKHIYDYKDKNGSKQFPLLLQKTEANLFIDQIRPILKSHGLITTGIHDSIVCKKEDAEVVRSVMIEVFERNSLIADIKLDNPEEQIKQWESVA